MLALACSAPAPAPSSLGYDDAEQVVVALHACVPSWVQLRARISLDASTISGLRIAPSSFGIDADDIDCVLAAGSDCTAVRACFGVEIYADDRCVGPPRQSCDGNTVDTCVFDTSGSNLPPVRFRWDCGSNLCDAAATRCDPPPCSGLAICRADYLVADCTPTPTETRCDPGTMCLEHDATASCVGAGPECMRTHCEGETVIVCDTADLRTRATIDCAPIDAHCTEDASGARCVPHNPTCSSAGSAPSCDHDAIVYCGPSGDLRRYDCRAHGLGTCMVTSAMFAPDIRCVPELGRLF